MLNLKKLETIQLTPSAITISWTYESSQEDFNSYRLYLYQAEAPAASLSEYTLIASNINPATTYSYADTTIAGRTDKWVDYFYVLVTSGLSGQGSSISSPIGISVIEDKYAREIERRRGLVLNYHSGQTFHILKRKSFGTVCPVCFDITLQRSTKSKCTTCYDTGYVGGFYNQIDCRGQLNERPTREMHQMFGQWQDQDAVLYIQANPPLNPKDIIVDRLFRRWVVLNVGGATKAMHTIGQIAQIRQIEKEDIIFQYPVTFT